MTILIIYFKYTTEFNKSSNVNIYIYKTKKRNYVTIAPITNTRCEILLKHVLVILIGLYGPIEVIK